MKYTKLRKFEFEYRIFISFTIVLVVCLLSFSLQADEPTFSDLLGSGIGISVDLSITLGYLIAILFMVFASVIRIWAGSILNSERMMSFTIQLNDFIKQGPYQLCRNPIYLADLIAFCGFCICLPISGILMPILLFSHYIQLIIYEENNLRKKYGLPFETYLKSTPRFLPGPDKLFRFYRSGVKIQFNFDGFRHNALYLFFIPGFLVSMITKNFIWTVLIGLPAVVDWAVIHTRIGVSSKKVKKVKKIFRDILYSQCWEDPGIDRQALQINNKDVVFSITSGGCNVLAFLLDDPKEIISLDMNPYQNYLLQLKIAAFKALDYEEMLAFLGVLKSKNRCTTYKLLQPYLTTEAQKFWVRKKEKIKKGIIHCGRYEKYMRILRNTLIKPIMNRKVINSLFSSHGTSERKNVFERKIKNMRWRILTRIMLSRFVNGLLFDKGFFQYLDENFSFGKHFAGKAEEAFINLPLKENYFLTYILTGNYTEYGCLPHYLREENFSIIRKRLDRIKIITGNCREYFSTLADNSLNKLNFSNIFEWMSINEYTDLLKETVRVSNNGSLIIYRNLLVKRIRPEELANEIHSDIRASKVLYKQDLSFIYNNYVCERIIKGCANEL